MSFSVWPIFWGKNVRESHHHHHHSCQLGDTFTFSVAIIFHTFLLCIGGAGAIYTPTNHEGCFLKAAPLRHSCGL